MKNVIVISHSSDIDGVGSAALIKMRYGVPTGRIFFTDYSPESLGKISRSVRRIASRGTTLFITDLGVNEDAVSVVYGVLKFIRDGGGRIFWFDHHPWAESYIRRLASMCELSVVGENKLFCATEITRRELGFKDSFTMNFCRIVHLSDFAIAPRSRRDYNTIGAYALSIALYHMRSHDENIRSLRHMVDVISSGRLFDNRIRDDANRFRRLNDRHVEGMLREVYLGDEMALGFGEDIQKTYACMKLMEKTGKDIGVYVNLRDRKGHMRSVHNDCTELASRFGGGGHPHASGFSPDFGKYNNFKKGEDRRKLLLDMEREFRAIRKRDRRRAKRRVKDSPARIPTFG
jgi:hypothetical protein